ncbi:NAD(P)H-dependent oxidoreductase [Candidatus Gracilibacteria bacterium CG17_big_fil_post_rev_8_21_14_2_50_48_13]|nr:MAG: NAD(P)H-dependent oxidoreductase [Candidatus Gracilibacteria bacterium CG17_big_fil_post_rev_8_21_14_2_50_48_13]
MDTHTLLNALQKRYATKVFDPTKELSQDILDAILESGRLAPSSIGLEPWKFLVVHNRDLRAQLLPAAYNQKQITDAAALIIIARRTDIEALPQELVERTAKVQGRPVSDLAGLKAMAEGGIKRPDADAWLAHQTFLPLGFMMYTAALLGVDSCPMEGFDASAVNALLGLPEKHLHAQCLLAIGYHGDDKYADMPKTRREPTEVMEIL